MSDDLTNSIKATLNGLVQKYGIPAFNAVVPAANAATEDEEWEVVPYPDQQDEEWEVVPYQASSQVASPPSQLPQGPGNVMAGVRRGLEKQKVGAEQTITDIPRWLSGSMGADYSPERQALNAEGERLKLESRNAPILDRFGEAALYGVEGAVPTPGGMVRGVPLRIPYNMTLGAMFGAMHPEADPTRRLENIAQGAFFGSTVPEGASLGMRGGYAVTDFGRGIISSTRGASRDLGRRMKEAGIPLDDGPPIEPPSRFIPPSDGMGPPRPKYDLVEGIQPTVGMLSQDPRVLAMEMNARNRGGGPFKLRDNQNLAAAHNAIERRALPDEQALMLEEQLNAKTGPMRESAYESARSDLDALTAPLKSYVERIRTAPGVRVDPNAQKLANQAERTLNPPARAESEVMVAPAQPRQIDRTVNPEKDDIITAIRKLGGIDKTEYGESWRQMDFGPNPVGPVWRNIDDYGRRVGTGIDDMAARLHQHGYLSSPDGNELEEVLFDHSRGVLDPSRLWSSSKSGYQDRGATSQEGDLLLKLDDLVTALNLKNAPKPKPETVQAEPEDLYTFRKLIDDSLRLKTLSADDLTNAAKNARREAVGIKGAVDEGMNAASGGKWSEYLTAHREGMKPITEGRSLQNILDRFDSATRLLDGETPTLSPARFRKAVDAETYTNLGKSGWADDLFPEQRLMLGDVQNVLDDISKARSGITAVNGSPTAGNLASLMRSGLVAGGGKFAAAINLLDTLGRSRGASALDRALLNPDEFAKVLNDYAQARLVKERLKNPKPGMFRRSVERSGATFGSDRD